MAYDSFSRPGIPASKTRMIIHEIIHSFLLTISCHSPHFWIPFNNLVTTLQTSHPLPHTMSEHGSAATRVFAIPELLQQILIALADQVSQTSQDEHEMDESYHSFEPATTIARCRMVNRDFNGTIGGSNKILELVAYISPKWDGVWSDRALGWLLQRQLNLDFSTDDRNENFVRWGIVEPGWKSPIQEYFVDVVPDEGYGKDMFHADEFMGHALAAYKGAFDEFLQRKSTVESTWRDVRPKHPSIETRVYVHFCCRDLFRDIELVAQDTLGDVFDQYGIFLTDTLALWNK